MKPALVNLNAPGPLFDRLVDTLEGRALDLVSRRFPDGETYLRFEDDVTDSATILVANLSPPDPQLFPVLAAADTLRDLGAASVGLVVPYLPYMRQDTRFRKGEAVSSRPFAKLLSEFADWLVTVDPHLHRYHSLNELYSIPNAVCPGAPTVVEWIREQVTDPVLIGPDEESEQWVAAVADEIPAPFTVLRKRRRGDRSVEVSVPHVEKWTDHTPVLVDDIISTGRTMIATIHHLQNEGLRPPVCIGTHAVFAGDAYEALEAAGPERIVTSNTIPHVTNAIDVSEAIAKTIRENGFLTS